MVSTLLLFYILFQVEDAEQEQEAPKEMIHTCTSTVSYTWQRIDDKDAVIDFESVTREASSEEGAKSELSRAVFDVKIQALEDCRQKHESIASCVASGIKKNQKDYRNWDFASRKAFLDSLTNGCKSFQGECKSSKASEPTCTSREVIPPPKPVEEE